MTKNELRKALLYVADLRYKHEQALDDAERLEQSLALKWLMTNATPPIDVDCTEHKVMYGWEVKPESSITQRERRIGLLPENKGRTFMIREYGDLSDPTETHRFAWHEVPKQLGGGLDIWENNNG